MKPDLNVNVTNEITRSLPVLNSRSVPPANGERVAVVAQETEPAVREQSNEDSARQLERLVEKLNNGAASIGRQLKFHFDDDANTSVIQVYDRETEQLIRQIPSEEALERMRAADGDVFQLIDTTA